MNAPVAPPKDAEALHALAWWAAERERVGTDWRSLLLTVMRTAGVVSPCDVCESEPCMSPSFCEACRQADAKREAKRKRVSDLKSRPTPQATIEAIKQSVRDRGVAALKEAANRERLSQCDNAARAEIDRWLTPFKAKEAAR
jgi:hypothetical protein